MIRRNRTRQTFRATLCVFLFTLLPAGRWCSAASLEDLKKLDIICFVPSYLPKGFRLTSVEITYDEIQECEDKNHPLPLYSVVYQGSSQTGGEG